MAIKFTSETSPVEKKAAPRVIAKVVAALREEVAKPAKRAKRGRYLAGKTVEAQKPWEAEGVSRRTWYARQKSAPK